MRAPRRLSLPRGPRRRRGRRTAGFLLLEALVAVGIMAFILSVLPSGIIVSRKTVQASAAVVGARLVAEAVLTNEFSGTLTAGASNGTLDGYEWAALVRPNAALQQTFPSRRWAPYDVIVQVLVPNGPKVTLETVRLGRRG